MTQFETPPGATLLDPDEMEGLKLKHITTRAELDRWEQENIQDALGWLERRRKLPILNEDFICQLHQKMFGKVWKWAGNYRRTNKNIGVEWPTLAFDGRCVISRYIWLKSFHLEEWKFNGFWSDQKVIY